VDFLRIERPEARIEQKKNHHEADKMLAVQKQRIQIELSQFRTRASLCLIGRGGMSEIEGGSQKAVGMSDNQENSII